MIPPAVLEPDAREIVSATALEQELIIALCVRMGSGDVIAMSSRLIASSIPRDILVVLGSLQASHLRLQPFNRHRLGWI